MNVVPRDKMPQPPWHKGIVKLSREHFAKLLGFPEGTIVGGVATDMDYYVWNQQVDDSILVKVYMHESLPRVKEGDCIPLVGLPERPGEGFQCQQQ